MLIFDFMIVRWLWFDWFVRCWL